jgi:hypothetical protein
MKMVVMLALAASIQTAGISSAAEVRNIKVRAVCTAAEFPLPTVHAHAADGATTAGKVRVKSYLNHESDALQCRGATLVLTAKEDPSAASHAEEVLGKFTLPEKGDSFILLLVPEVGAKAANKVRVLVIDDGAKAFPKGSFKIANLSPLPVRITLEKKPFEFAPGAIENIVNPPMSENHAATMTAEFQREAKWETFSSTRWPHPGDKRVLQVIVENPTTKMLEMRGIRDVVGP